MNKFVKLWILALSLTAPLLISHTAQAATTQSGCDDYAVMRCGATSPQDFITKARANDTKDLRALYQNYGLPTSEYDRFAREARPAKIFKDGRIEVDGRIAGRTTQNVGRIQDTNFNQPITVANMNDKPKTFYGGTFGDTYHADTADGWVLFDDTGALKFVVIASCGNPQRGESKHPTYACDSLQKTAVAGTANRYSFTTKAPVTEGAEVVSVTYDFGDGQSRTVSDPAKAVEHTFAATSTVKVNVQIRLPGGGTKTVTSVNCATVITVTPPVTPPTPPVVQQQANAFCTQLKSELLDQDRRIYRFTAVANTQNATFNRADFRFSDNQSAVMPALPVNNEATLNHAFPNDGAYTVSATLFFTRADGTTFSGDCTAAVDAKATAYCKPGIPVGSKDCEAQLTDTGPGAIIAGMFGGAGAIGTTAHYIARRRFNI